LRLSHQGRIRWPCGSHGFSCGIPEILEWSGARPGLLYRLVKQQITLRLVADVLAWFRANASGGCGYQTDINSVVREYAQRTLNDP